MRRSLSLRLMAYAAGAIGLALVIAWLALGLLFERHVERQLEAELRRHGTALIAGLTLDPRAARCWRRRRWMRGSTVRPADSTGD